MAYPNNYPSHNVPPYQSQNYQLTTEEKRVLKECARESFYRRCVPFMTAFGLGAYYGVHLGYLKKHITYGAAPKVATGMLIGFISGKLSYKNACEEKILRLPGGKLKEILMARNASDKLWSGSIDDGGLYNNASLTYALPPYASVPFRSNELSTASELDTERHHDNFDDSFKIKSDMDGNGSEDLPPLIPPAQSTSYNELRSRNREEYEARRRQYKPGPVDDHAPFTGNYSPSIPTSDRFSRADSYQSPISTADRVNKTNSYQTPNEGFDQYNQSSDRYYSSEQNSIQQRTPTQWKNFYGDIIEK